MSRRKPHIPRPARAPYAALIPCLIVAVFLIPKPHSFGGWVLYLTFLIGPFLVCKTPRSRDADTE